MSAALPAAIGSSHAGGCVPESVVSVQRTARAKCRCRGPRIDSQLGCPAGPLPHSAGLSSFFSPDIVALFSFLF